MRISDWSSDVCSSDLSAATGDGKPHPDVRHGQYPGPQRPSGNIVWSQCHWRGRVDLLLQTYLRLWRLWGSRIWAFQCFTHRMRHKLAQRSGRFGYQGCGTAVSEQRRVGKEAYSTCNYWGCVVQEK